MRRETVLAGAIGVVVVAMLLFVVFVPGAVAERETPEERGPSGDVRIREVNIAPGPVSGGSATLRVDTRIQHHGPPVDNVTLEVRAVDSGSGLVRATRRIEVDDVTENGETRVTTDLSVPRSGGYRIETVLYQDGRREEVGTKSVQGVGSLTPAYADTPIHFHQFDGPGVADLPPVEYSIADVEGDRVTLRLSAFLTNDGDGNADDLRVVFKARQSDSNIVTDETEVRVGDVSPGATVSPTGELTVPDGYNYYVEAYVWRGDTLITAARSTATLNPNETIEVKDTDDGDGGLQVGDFESDEEPEDDVGGGTGGPMTTTGSTGPGLGVGVAVVGLVVLALLGRRYHD